MFAFQLHSVGETNMKDMLIALFISLGGVGMVIGLVLKYAPEYAGKGLLWFMNKFPKVKEFVHDHLKEIEELEDALLASIKKAEEQA